MKKLLLGIFAFLIGFISFSSAETFMMSNSWSDWGSSDLANIVTINVSRSISITSLCTSSHDWSFSYNFVLSGVDNDYIISSSTDSLFYEQIGCVSVSSPVTLNPGSYTFSIQRDFANVNYFDGDSCIDGFYTFDNGDIFSISMPCLGMYFYGLGYDLVSIPTPEITVFYDYGHSSTTVSCNGDNSIYINGMASLSGISNFTPFFNISYIDEDNQNLIESYNKDILYLEDGKFKKTYTGDNQWILSVQEQSNGLVPDVIFTGLDNLPVTVTGESDNVFSNFGDNALTLISSNIPGIITWGFILFIILFIIRLFIPKNRR